MTNNDSSRDDHRWPSLGTEVASTPATEIDEIRAAAEAEGYRVGSQRAEAELARLRTANSQCVNDANAVINSLDADLASLIVQCVESVASAVVAAELVSSSGVAQTLVNSALEQLKTQAQQCVLEVAPGDVEHYIKLLDGGEVRGVEDIESPGFRLIHGFARREFRPDELIAVALGELEQSPASHDSPTTAEVAS